MEPIRSLDEPDPVQRYVRRAARVRSILVVVLLTAVAVLAYWGLNRWL